MQRAFIPCLMIFPLHKPPLPSGSSSIRPRTRNFKLSGLTQLGARPILMLLARFLPEL